MNLFSARPQSNSFGRAQLPLSRNVLRTPVLKTWRITLLGLILVGAFGAGALPGEPDSPRAERKSLEYLVREVPQWSKANRCYSCHNNGDAARALYAVIRLPGSIKKETLVDSLADTTTWLSKPENWDHNGGEGPFSDKVLARIQFSSTLAAARTAGLVTDHVILTRAAELLARDQAADGSWPVEGAADAIGSPASYGQGLATVSARDSLQSLDSKVFDKNVAKADRWLLNRPVENVLDASVALLAASERKGPEWLPLRERALKILREGQSTDGGWGPFVRASPEPFDTALAILALCKIELGDSVISDMIKRGRNYLIACRLDDGSWRETTRPAGAESYAQRLSTTGWAALALQISSAR